MKRMSYINWQKSVDVLPEQTGRKYLILSTDGVIDKMDEPDYCIAVFYKKGDTVQLKRKEPKAIDESSDSQKLMRALGFFDFETVTIEKDGFYVKEASINSVYDGCIEDLICYDISDSLFWAMLPLVPNGVEHPYDIQDEKDKRDLQRKKEADLRRKADLMDYINNNLSAVTTTAIIHDITAKPDFYTHGIIFESDTDIAYKALASLIATLDVCEMCCGEGLVASKTEDIDKLTSYMSNSMHGFDKNILSVVALLAIVLVMDDSEANDGSLKYYRYMASPKRYCVQEFFKRSITDDTVINRAIIAEIFYNIDDYYCRIKKFSGSEYVKKNVGKLLIGLEIRKMFNYFYMLFAKMAAFVTPEMAEERFGSNYAEFGGCYDFSSCFGFTPEKELCEYNPREITGPCLRDVKGVFVPVYGQDKDGNVVRFHARKHVYAADMSDDKHFYSYKWQGDEIVRLKEYTITERNYFEKSDDFVENN